MQFNKIKKLPILIMLSFVSLTGFNFLPQFRQVAEAAPAKCIIFNGGSRPTSAEDDSYSLADCESSPYKDLRVFEDNKYYNIGIHNTGSPIYDTPTVIEITKADYESQVNINIDKAISGGSNLDADCDSGTLPLTQENCGIIGYLVVFTNILSALVGIVIVIMIAVGGIQYSTARDNPQATAGAKGRIVNALIALVVYLFGFAILQWLIPGGIF